MAEEMNQQQQGGSGSAENKGDARDAQKASLSSLNEQQAVDIAEQTGLQPTDVADLQSTGALSGRDDAAGGSGDNMTGTSSNEGTERL